MKKIKLLIVLVLCTLPLSGCKVNWFSESYEVPWYTVVLPIAAIFIIAHITIMSGVYICPDCGTEIKPKWYHFYTYMHLGGKRLAKCPNCKRMGFCIRKKKVTEI